MTTAANAQEPMVAMHVLRALVEMAEIGGVPRSALLGAASLEGAPLSSGDARIPRGLVYRAVEAALELTGNPALALHWAERLARNNFVPLSYLVAHAGSLRQGFACVSQFERLLNDEPSYQLHEEGERATIACPPMSGESEPMQRFTAEMRVASFWGIVRAFNPGARAEQVSFAYAAPAHADEYTRVLGQPASFDQPFTGVIFARALLDTPSPLKDEALHDALKRVAEQRLAQLDDRAPYALRVREVLVERGWPARIDMETVARHLGLSVRSLRRRLAAEGKSYPDIESDAFVLAAKQRLRDEQRTIQETAFDMGFSDTTTFHRAFKRATGTTPRQYRETAVATGRRHD